MQSQTPNVFTRPHLQSSMLQYTVVFNNITVGMDELRLETVVVMGFPGTKGYVYINGSNVSHVDTSIQNRVR